MSQSQPPNHRIAAAPPTENMKKLTTTPKTRTVSDADSQISDADSFHSIPSPFHTDNSKALVAVTADKYYSPGPSLPPISNQRHRNLEFPAPATPPATPPASNFKVDRVVKEEVVAGVTRVGPTGEGLGFDEEVGGQRRSRAAVESILKRSRKDLSVERAALGLRVCEIVLCLISFSVMAADKTQGWSGDSFDRYKEYRYCLSVAVIAFVYSGLQASDLAYHSATGKNFISHHLRYHFDFVMDQILAYLLVSASSSAATRVDDWVSNWGKDQFTEMATASIGMSFLAFAAFASSSLISGYNLCNRVSSGL
ncbi:CASP-like protein 4A3 [Apium graveolens]|uniref:CASP-like protein 4A3 n=1 Tax=Apium graveolens TaxID=4045 RepID=UPI003D7BB9E0